MFHSLPEVFREFGLSTDVRTLLLLRKAVDKDLVKTIGDLYNVLKGIVVKDPTDMGPFTKAYYHYFLDIEVRNGESLEDAILRSETFKNWKINNLDESDRDFELDTDEQINRFLDQVHMTHFDIKEIISGKDILSNDDPNHKDDDEENTQRSNAENTLDKMADYSDMSIDELLDRLKKIRDQQNTEHGGGSHWIGVGGISPFGHGGAAKNGIRIGGSGGGRMARKVLNDKNYFPIDRDAIINDNNVDAALAAIKGVIEESAMEQLDIPITIKSGLKRGGLFIPELKNEKNEKLQVIVLIDNGGYSMSPYVKTVRDLLKKMKTRF